MVETRSEFALATGEDAVLLRELCHRAGNDGAVALAAVRVLGDARLHDPARRAMVVEQASARLEASARLNRLLARPVPPRAELREWLGSACGALGEAGDAVELDVDETWVDGPSARRLVLIAAELVANALKYAGPDGRPRVAMRTARGRLALRVSDEGPGFEPGAPARGGGLGSGIVADLVRIGGGRLAFASGPAGTTVTVDMPARIFRREHSRSFGGAGPVGRVRTADRVTVTPCELRAGRS